MCTAPYAPSELMKLCQSETLRIFHQHHRCIWHVDAYFNYGGGNQHVNLSRRKSFHNAVFVRRTHLPMQTGNLNRGRQSGSKLFRVIRYIFKSFGFAFLYHRADTIYLSFGMYFFCNKIICLRTPAGSHNTDFDGTSAAWQLINHRYMQISI